MTALPASKLVEDKTLYPRQHGPDASYVSELMRAVEAGAVLPLPVVDKASRRIVDGWHRVRVYKRLRGPDAEVEVDLRSFPDELAMKKAAAELNAEHGRKLDQQDRIRVVLMLSGDGVTDDEIAGVLRTTEKRVTELRTRVFIVEPKNETRPAKPVVYPAHGEPPRVFSEEQARVIASSNGNRTAQTVTQLTNELRAGITDLQQPGLCAKLHELAQAIIELVPEPAAAGEER